MRRPSPTLAFCIFSLFAFMLNANLDATFCAEAPSAAKPTIEELKQDRFKLLRDKWLEYTRAMFATKSTATYKQLHEDGTPIQSFEMEIDSYYPNYAYLSKPDDGGERLNVFGSGYSFNLTRQTAEQPWELENVTEVEKQVPLDSWKYPESYGSDTKDEFAGRLIADRLVFGLQTGCSVFLPSLLSLEDLDVERFEYVTVDGKELLYLKVRYVDYKDPNLKSAGNDADSEALKAKSETHNAHGEFWLDTDYFLIVKANYTETLDRYLTRSSDITIEYDNSLGVPAPKRYQNKKGTKTEYPGDEKTDFTHLVEIDFHSVQKNKKGNAKRFKLSYYGLKEPELKNAPKSGNRTRYIVLIAGIALFAVAVGQIYRRRRARSEGRSE